MGIWVREQNKSALICCGAIGTNNVNQIWAENDASQEVYIIGKYDSNSEALQVLDEIQNLIDAIQYYKCVGKDRDMPCPPFVFEMPEAGFSIKPEKFYPDCAADLNHCGYLDNGIEAFYPDPDKKGEVPKCSGYHDCKAAWDRGCR